MPSSSEQVQASFENGVLTVTVPKTGRQERSRRIQVQGQGAPSQGTAGGNRRTANIQPIGPIPGHEIELNVGRVMGTAVVHLGEVPAAPISRSTSFSKARFWVATKRR